MFRDLFSSSSLILQSTLSSAYFCKTDTYVYVTFCKTNLLMTLFNFVKGLFCKALSQVFIFVKNYFNCAVIITMVILGFYILLAFINFFFWIFVMWLFGKVAAAIIFLNLHNHLGKVAYLQLQFYHFQIFSFFSKSTE